MKTVYIRILALILTLCMVVPLMACGESSDNGDATFAENDGDTAVEGTEAFKPDIQKTNYGETFTSIACSDTFVKGYFFREPLLIEF